ncbi:9053_t:CDS:2 [Acaulospora morrowiae]|uniref:9053_t:CDS:1 n=1 Tax=Acaulospora morrowiae TaxID=94023 RepID=A0A9N9GW40_9GLOM|nr:9053_t:CDS:2 [Acaulospora morrowiae]
MRFAKENTTLTPIETQYLINEIVKAREAVDARNKRGEESFCPICKLPKHSSRYCEHCMRVKLKKEVWTSGNPKIDAFLRKHQDESPVPYCIIEWIEFRDLKNVEFLAEGGYGKVYSATWTRGWIIDWDMKENNFIREPRNVALKIFNNNNFSKNEIFQEANWNQIFTRDRTVRNFVVLGLGFTKNEEGEYMIVFDFCEGGDLRAYLQKHYKNMSWKDKIGLAWNISVDLYRISETGSIHGDLHPGNILLLRNGGSWVISDLGTCESVDAQKEQMEVKGVPPYIAPELLEGYRKTKESDIYAFGIIMWEISAGCAPLGDRSIDRVRISLGLRPPIVPGTPKIYADLMQNCWAANPRDRISAKDAAKTLQVLMRNMMENNFVDEYPVEENQSCKSQESDSSTHRTSKVFRRQLNAVLDT